MRARWLWILWLVVAAAPAHVRAQSASVQAQSLFDEGRRLLKANKVAEACAAFDSSEQLDPAVTTLLNLAECREQNDQLATAWGLFVDAGRMARTANNDKLVKVAGNHARKLEPRLSKLTIAVAADRQLPGLEIARGGEPVNPASWNHALPIDGGTYTIIARAPGRTAWTITKVVKPEGDSQTIEIPKLVDPRVAVAAPVSPPPAARPAAPTPPATKPAAPPPAKSAFVDNPHVSSEVPPPATVAATTPARAERDQVVEPPSHASLRLPIILGATALVLGGVALGLNHAGDVLYDHAKVEFADANMRGDTVRAQDAVTRHDAANTRRYMAQGFGIAAVGCAGAAVYFYLRGRGEHTSETALITPVASPQLSGLAVLGHW